MIDQRVFAALAGMTTFVCLCCCGILFLTPTDTEPTAAIVENTAVLVEAPPDTLAPIDILRPSDTPECIQSPEPT